MTRRGKAPQGRAEDEKEEDTVLCLNQSRRLSSRTQQIYIAHGACVVEGRCGAARNAVVGTTPEHSPVRGFAPRAISRESPAGHWSQGPNVPCAYGDRRLVPPLCKEETPRPQGFFSLAPELCPPLLEKSKGTCQVPK